MKHYTNSKIIFAFLFIALLIFGFVSCKVETDEMVSIQKGTSIALIGNNLCSRMLNFGHFESQLHMRFPDSMLYVRNFCDGGNTAGFRPHSGRDAPWAFPGAEAFQDEYAQNASSKGHLASEDEWLTRHKADIILAFFGYSESFEGPERLENFKGELTAFIKHTRSQAYNGNTPPELILVSPIGFEDLSDQYDLPDGKEENENLSLYSKAMEEVAQVNEIQFINVFDISKKWMDGVGNLTSDGSQLNDDGYNKFATYLVDAVFGGSPVTTQKDAIYAAVKDKNWFWHNDFKIPNGVHTFGRRYNPFGPDNYPFEFKKIREMTAIRDTGIWMAAQGKSYDITRADAKTTVLPIVESNYKPGDHGLGDGEYLYGDDALNTLSVPEGYKIELFASEREFPDLANPVQMSFDDKGRLWVAVMPTYPHYKPGDAMPNDKLIILEDTDGDHKADKQIIWADGLHIPVGFEFAPEGVYVSQGTNFKLLTDTDGDDKADKEEIILSGFDDHDTHHVISAFCADPSGAIYSGEGLFLQTNVETSYGTVRATNGGFYRYSPQRKHLERTAQLAIPNPWGIAFDDWGQNIFAETSGPAVRWMLPGSIKPRYGQTTHKSFDLIKDEHKVRPTSGLEFIHSRHFPNEVQGDLLIANSIGFLGMKQHKFDEDGTGYKTDLRHDIVVGTDPNFRPVDMEIAPDGSLYFLDWHNVLIGHMQHNARDPYRDHVHGRVYRITYPSRPLVEPAEVHGASIETLLDNLKLPEYRTRYRSRRALRGRDKNAVMDAAKKWISELDGLELRFEHHLLEAMWVYWGMNELNKDLLEQVMLASDYRARAAAVRMLRYNGHLFDKAEDHIALLTKAAGDPSGRVRLEAIAAASWLESVDDGMTVLNTAAEHELDEWIVNAHLTAVNHLNGINVPKDPEKGKQDGMPMDASNKYAKGEEIYLQDGYCGTCHQENGKGLIASGYPSLVNNNWVLGDEERLIKLTLKGLYGPIEVDGKSYPGNVPMTPFEGLLNDEEIAAVLTYVRSSFGNRGTEIKAEAVKKIRAEITDKKGFYTPADLLVEHPMEASL